MSIHAFLSDVPTWLAQFPTDPFAPPPTPLIPDPAPIAPPGKLAAATNTLLGWMKWAGLVGGVGALIAAGIMMAIGRRNRNNMAIEGAISLPWVVAGLALVLGAAGIVGFVLDA